MCSYLIVSMGAVRCRRLRTHAGDVPGVSLASGSRYAVLPGILVGRSQRLASPKFRSTAAQTASVANTALWSDAPDEMVSKEDPSFQVALQRTEFQALVAGAPE